LEFVSFPPFLPKKFSLFYIKLHIFWETNELKFKKKMKSLSVLDTFSSGGCKKNSKFERVMLVQRQAHDGKNGVFFLFFPQKQ